MSPENLFWVLGILLAVALLGRLGWWRETGFNRSLRWRNLHLLLFPFLVVTLTLFCWAASGSQERLYPFSEELLYRGVVIGRVIAAKWVDSAANNGVKIWVLPSRYTTEQGWSARLGTMIGSALVS